ncbi:phage protein, HK97 gp10 family [Chitinophaga eiseniae]|uniref:Phage protein, HK97 gp10 family n=1 Tax=Chitinophaga eiseniae TaxID=634771 RepID=A0A1T4SNK5_9BACT|nr:HK97-gp10 family putative phage morphogenesis protein [Chitinophaga eiseniae]SKA29775.1 phage protein, HK97 gp10 family [Chitinophaga eiseniae]
MGAKFAFNFTGITELLRDVQHLEQNVIQNLDNELKASAETIVNNAKAMAPSETGALKQSISFTRNGILDYNVTAAVHYAPYVEFGTGALVDVPAGLESYAIQFKGRGIKQVNMPAHPYLFPAFEQERRLLIERLKAELLRASSSGITVIRPSSGSNITGITTI